jgi:predicted HTH domain antitoxin
MTIEIPQERLDAALRSENPINLIREIVLALYSQEVISGGKARKLLGLSVLEFHKLLREHQIPWSYDADELRKDVETLKRLGQW